MPLFFFDDQDIGAHSRGGHAEEALIKYLDKIGADELADDIVMSTTERAMRRTMQRGLEALQELTDDGLEWIIEHGDLILR